MAQSKNSNLYELDYNLVCRFCDLVVELSELKALRSIYPKQDLILSDNDVQLLFNLYDSLDYGKIN